jgi:hypothetical protein
MIHETGHREEVCMFGLIAGVASSLSVLVTLLAAAPDENPIARDKQALAPLQPYVGQWRGVALPKRGSSAGAWTETCAWAWRFEKGRAELVAELKDDKYYDRLQLQPGEKPGQFVLLASIAPQSDKQPAAPPQRFVGEINDGALVVTSADSADDRPVRISLRLVAAGDRMLVLYEKRLGKDLYARLAEVGSTRQGSAFAKTALGGPECVVTGGLGTIAVEHEGKKYFVCCSGCRDLFLEGPDAVLEEYRQRKAAERAQKLK